MSKATLEKLVAAVEDLRSQVAALSERVATLEKPSLNGTAAAEAAAPPAPPKAAPAAEPAPPPPPKVEQAISPEMMLAISAAVAAYLGERAHIRAVRLIGTTRWSQEGRVSIQASHRLQRI